MCECKLCMRNKEFVEKLANVQPEDQAFFDSLNDTLQEVEMERNYLASVMDGSWPGAVGVLEQMLVKAKLKQLDTTQ